MYTDHLTPDILYSYVFKNSFTDPSQGSKNQATFESVHQPNELKERIILEASIKLKSINS